MFAIIIITAFTVVFTVFNYDSFLPAVHQMSQSLYENTVHRWHVPASIGANTNNLKLNQVVQTFNASSANATFNGTVPTNPIKNETVQPTASTNKLYEIEVNQADFDKCSKATINFNDIIPTSNNVNELIPEVIPNTRKVVTNETATTEKPEEKSKVESETEKKVHRNVQYKCDKSGLLIAAAIAVVYVKFLRSENSSTEPIEESLKSPPTETEEEKKKKCLKPPSTEEEKKPFEIHQSLKSPSTEAFIQLYTQEMYHQLPFTTNENSQDEYCFTTQPTSDNSSDLSLKEAPATPTCGFVEHELACLHLSDHLIGLMDWSQYYKHFQPGEVDMFEVAKEFEAPLNPADILVEVTTDSTETPEEKSNEQAAIEDNTNSIEPLEDASNEQAEPATTAIESNTYSIEPLEEKTATHSEPAIEMPEEKPTHATHSEPADLVVEVKANSIEPLERRRHSQTGSSEDSTNFTDEDSSDTNVQVEEVKPKESEKVKENRCSFDTIGIKTPTSHTTGKEAKINKHFEQEDSLRIYRIQNKHLFDYSRLVTNENYTSHIGDLIENSLNKLMTSITPWCALEPFEPHEIDNMQKRFIRNIRDDNDVVSELFVYDNRFSNIVTHVGLLRELINEAMKKLYTIKDTDYSKDTSHGSTRNADICNLKDVLDKVRRKEIFLNWNQYYRYSDVTGALLSLQ